MKKAPQRRKTILEKLLIETALSTNNGVRVSSAEQVVILNSAFRTIEFLETLDYIMVGLLPHVNVFCKVYFLSDKPEVLQKRLMEASQDFDDSVLSREPKRKVEKRFTRSALADKLFIDTKTLYEYTNKYMLLFDRFLAKNGYTL